MTTDHATPHLRLVIEDPPPDAVADRSFVDKAAVALDQIDVIVGHLLAAAAEAGPEAMLHVHQQLGTAEAITHEGRAKAAEAIHHHIQAHGTLVNGATTYRTLDIGGVSFKAKADRSGRTMSVANAIRMWSMFEASVVADVQGQAAEAGAAVASLIAKGDDLPDAVVAVCKGAVRQALEAVTDCYGTTTGTGGKNARSAALSQRGVTKARYVSSSEDATTTYGFVQVVPGQPEVVAASDEAVGA